MLFTRLDDTGGGGVEWIPAHCKAEQVEGKLKGDGTQLTRREVEGNAEADRLSKKAVEEHRIEGNYIERWDKLKTKPRLLR